LETIEERADAFHDLVWWAAERERVGTDWRLAFAQHGARSWPCYTVPDMRL
jgi:hypothetical protein